MLDYSNGNDLYFLKKRTANSGEYYSSFIEEYFIKYFEIKEENIIIYYSKGQIKIPYSKTYEKELLEKMKMQILSWYEITTENESLKSYFKLLSIRALLSLKFKKAHEFSLMYKDYLKNVLFYKNEDIINESVKEKAKELGIDSTPHITINDIHFLTMEEVENLVDGKIDSSLILKLSKN